MQVPTDLSLLPMIVLEPLLHRNKHWIAIKAPNLETLNQQLRLLQGNTFSKTHKCWLVPLNKELYKKIYYQLQPFAQLNTLGMKKWFTEHADHSTAATVMPAVEKPLLKFGSTGKEKTDGNALPAIDKSNQQAKAGKNKNTLQLSQQNVNLLQRMQQHLHLKSYSPSTQRTYLSEMGRFLQSIKTVSAESFTTQRLKDYLQYCHTELKLSENTIHSRFNALKFYYEQVLNREKFFWEIPRPKKQLQLPKTFNQDEIAGIINSMHNKKHKVMLMVAYSAGLRVSEVIALKTYNIDSVRMCIFIDQAKGKKDRMVTLSPVLLVMLREYASTYKPSGGGYLFEGATKGTPYSSRSLQEVIQSAKTKAGIMKPGSIHSLRHSFATHLLDKGTDITMIQKLLGHNDIKTTLRYLHTSNKDLLKIISPLDNLNLK